MLNWWQDRGKIWTKNFRNLIREYRYLENDGDLSQELQKLLQKYYRANLFLVECLNSNSQISPATRAAIEEKILINIFI